MKMFQFLCILYMLFVKFDFKMLTFLTLNYRERKVSKMMHSASENESLQTLHAFPEEFLFFAVCLLLECSSALSYFVVWTPIQLTCLCTELHNLITSYNHQSLVQERTVQSIFSLQRGLCFSCYIPPQILPRSGSIDLPAEYFLCFAETSAEVKMIVVGFYTHQ